MTELTGKTVMITGASRGIGEAAARLFAKSGCNTVLLARSRSAIDALAAELGDSSIAIATDVARYSDLAEATAAAEKQFGAVDILINNAGVIEPIAPLAGSDPEDWGHVIDINLKGVYYGMRAVVPGMISRGGGTVITISSGAAHNALDGWSHYCTSKAGARC